MYCGKAGRCRAWSPSQGVPPEALGLLQFLRSPRRAPASRRTHGHRSPLRSLSILQTSPRSRPHPSSCGRTTAVQGLRRCLAFHRIIGCDRMVARLGSLARLAKSEDPTPRNSAASPPATPPGPDKSAHGPREAPCPTLARAPAIGKRAHPVTGESRAAPSRTDKISLPNGEVWLLEAPFRNRFTNGGSGVRRDVLFGLTSRGTA